MSNRIRAVAIEWITPPVVVPALIAIAVVAAWLNN
jgi:hypothetical protein